MSALKREPFLYALLALRVQGIALLYSRFLSHCYLDSYFFRKSKGVCAPLFFLIFSFFYNRTFINLQNKRHKDCLSLATGLFIKFFERKKALKKSKTLKLLMAKFLRKLFLVLKIKRTICLVKKTPNLILEMLRIFNEPIIHKFTNPLTATLYDETARNYPFTKFEYLVFLESRSYALNKVRKLGRVKRKIMRKVVMQNDIID